jgi:hypothetical protein
MGYDWKEDYCTNCSSDTHIFENCKKIDADDEDEPRGCFSIFGGFLLAIATASTLYAASYLKSAPQQTTQTLSKLEQTIIPKPEAKTLKEKCDTTR